MANFIERTLEPGEKIIFKGHLHWYFNFRYTFWGLLLIILGVCLMGYVCNQNFDDGTVKAEFYASIVLAVVGICSILFGYFLRVKTEFAITNTRFVQKDGIFNIRLTEIPLFKVETVNFYQSFFERIVKTGCIELVGSGGTNHKVSFIQQPFEVRNLVTTYMKETKSESVAPAPVAPSAPAPATPTPTPTTTSTN